MRNDAELGTGPVWAAKRDSRITWIGHGLRYLHLDELPQIINVIRGEMDFVGPRPERPEIVSELTQQVPGYMSRHEAMPGITGIAQVNLKPDQEIECVRKKVAADRYYIENASLWLDVRLVSATLLRMMTIRYERGAKLLGVTLPPGVLPSPTPADVCDLDREALIDDDPPADADDTQVYASVRETVSDTRLDELDPTLAEAATAASAPRVPR